MYPHGRLRDAITSGTIPAIVDEPKEQDMPLTEPSTHADLMKQVATRLIAAWILFPAFLLGTGGTLWWWQAWVYCALLLLPMTVFALWMSRRDPESLERRMKVQERDPVQRRIQIWGGIFFLVLMTLPGIDHRYGWSDPPLIAELIAMAIVMVSYIAILGVFVVNRWAGRTVETYTEQTVVATGPYAIVRHPMYSGVVALSLATPVALGSWWSLLPMLGVLPMIAIRIDNEEAILTAELPGYADYCARVHWKLIPHVW